MFSIISALFGGKASDNLANRLAAKEGRKPTYKDRIKVAILVMMPILFFASVPFILRLFQLTRHCYVHYFIDWGSRYSGMVLYFSIIIKLIIVLITFGVFAGLSFFMRKLPLIVLGFIFISLVAGFVLLLINA